MEEGIETLKARYEECLAKEEELKEKGDLCSARLSRAGKVCVPLFCMAQQGREGMCTSVLAIVPRPPHPAFVAYGTKRWGEGLEGFIT